MILEARLARRLFLAEWARQFGLCGRQRRHLPATARGRGYTAAAAADVDGMLSDDVRGQTCFAGGAECAVRTRHDGIVTGQLNTTFSRI